MHQDHKKVVLHIAANLARGTGLSGLSSIPEDMPKTTPKSILRRISHLEELHKQWALALAATTKGTDNE